VAQRPSVRWNEGKQRWMAWVRFPDGSRRKVERVEKADAERDLNELLARRAEEAAPDPRRLRLATFNDVMDDWFDAGCPKAAVSKNSRHARTKSENTIATARYLLDGHVRPVIGGLRVDRTRTERVERVFQRMDGDGYATSTIDHAWSYLNQACQHAVRRRKIKINPAADVLLPEARPPRQRKSLTVEQVRTLLTVAIRQDRRPALWLTGLMCGPRPGELTGLRWPLVDIDSDDPHILFDERANEVNKRYVGQADPKTSRKGAIGLHPLVIAALRRHRTEMTMLGLYDPEGFVFPTRNGTAISVSNLRRAFRRLLDRAGLPGQDWTTYELRHTFVSVVSDQLGDLAKVADLAGHSNTKTTEGYRHAIRETLPHAVNAWNSLLNQHHDRDVDASSPAGRTFATWDPTASSIPAATQQTLWDLEWLERHEHLWVSGPAGTGKSHFVEALGHRAIDQGHHVACTTLSRLGALARRHPTERSITQAVDDLLQADLVVIDGLGPLPASRDATEAFSRLVRRANQTCSLAITSRVDPIGLDQLMPAQETSDIDQLVRQAHILRTDSDADHQAA
jgi:integrase